ILAASHIALLLSQSADPGYYYEVAKGHHPFSFPCAAVCVSVGFIGLEAALLAFVLTPPVHTLWGRGLFCLAVLLPCAVLGIGGSMIMPPYFAVHALWFERKVIVPEMQDDVRARRHVNQIAVMSGNVAASAGKPLSWGRRSKVRKPT